MKQLILLPLLFTLFASQAQQVTITILPTLNGLPVEPERRIVAGSDTILIEKLMFYISGISVSNPQQRFYFGEQAKLVSAGNDNRIIIPTAEDFAPTALSFTFGTDSILNCSGVMGGDLDPAFGMYWAWQSGYINFKLEGTSASGKNFQLHLGGYKHPFGTARNVTLAATNPEVIVELPIDGLLNKITADNTQTVMRPCVKGAELCTFVAENFRLKE